MKTTMSSRERILATCAHAPTDHLPLHLEVHPSYSLYDPEIAWWDDQFQRTDDLLALGADAMVEVWLPDPSYHHDVEVHTWREEPNDQEYALLCKEYRTPAGPLRQIIKETDDLYDWHKINRNTRGPIADMIDGVGLLEDVNPSRSVEFLIKGPQDIEKMRYLFQPISGEEYEKWREAALFAKREAEKRDAVFLARRTHCGSDILWLTDVQDSMISLATQPEYIQEFLRIIQNWQLHNLEMVLDVGVDMVTRFGYYDTPDFWGVKYFEQFLLPLLNEEAELCHQAGALLCQQQSEGITQQVDAYADSLVDVFRDVDPLQGNEDIALLKQKLGKSKTLMGGLNIDIWLANAEPDKIDTYIEDMIELVAPGGGFILHPIPGIYAGVPWKKILQMIQAWKRYA
jgi:hypothetical protein